MCAILKCYFCSCSCSLSLQFTTSNGKKINQGTNKKKTLSTKRSVMKARIIQTKKNHQHFFYTHSYSQSANDYIITFIYTLYSIYWDVFFSSLFFVVNFISILSLFFVCIQLTFPNKFACVIFFCLLARACSFSQFSGIQIWV